MAQLKNDCFAFGGDMMAVSDAWALLREKIQTVAGVEAVALDDALGRTLARDVVSNRAVPPHDNSAVDGYAVHYSALNADGDTRLKVTGRVAAGHPLGRAAGLDEAIRIFTGAQMPEGPDTVFMDEDATVDGDAVILPAGLKKGANYRLAGEDVEAGATILAAGVRLRPQDIGVAASVGLTELPVRTRLRAAVFSTGDEIRDPGDAAGAGCVYDSNRAAIKALLGGLGVRVTDLGILPDDRSAIEAALAGAASAHDFIITSGGVSLGEEDHVKAAVAALGRIDLWRIAIKPGRPIALGCIGADDGATPFVGLPGNPVAAMVTFMMIARPLILLLGGRTDIEPVRYALAAGFDQKKKPGRREWLRARVETAADGTRHAVVHGRTGAGILTSMVASDGLVELTEACEGVEKGDMVDYLPFNEVFS